MFVYYIEIQIVIHNSIGETYCQMERDILYKSNMLCKIHNIY